MSKQLYTWVNIQQLGGFLVDVVHVIMMLCYFIGVASPKRSYYPTGRYWASDREGHPRRICHIQVWKQECDFTTLLILFKRQGFESPILPLPSEHGGGECDQPVEAHRHRDNSKYEPGFDCS